MAGEVVVYEVFEAVRATCQSCGEVFPTDTKDTTDDRVVGHLISTHNWTKANALAYVQAKVYTPPSVTNP